MHAQMSVEEMEANEPMDMKVKSGKSRFDEDWLPVIIGGFLIALVLLGVRPLIPSFQWSWPAGLAAIVSPRNLLASLVIGVLYLAVSLAAIIVTGGKPKRFLAGFPILFIASWLSQAVAGNASVSWIGFEYVIFALLFGLAIGNLLPVPVWLAEAARSELYIKMGLVLLGAGILFNEILQAGVLGILQAVLVVFAVWSVCWFLCRKIGVDAEFAAILSSAVSICGVSAAIAACGAINGDRKKLSYVISLTLIVALPMMVLMPWIARAIGLPEAVSGAWMGGTLDTTGSVVAATSLIGEKATRIGTIVKFSQNVLIGLAAFALSAWWALRGKRGGGDRPSPKVIWDRFPKFVLGFLAASLVFSFALSPSLVKETRALLASLRTAWFALAFVSIGIETRFRSLVSMQGGRPAVAFLGAQLFNVLWTLLLAWLLFGGRILPVPF
jgi:uncharacterized membrane protein YadS